MSNVFYSFPLKEGNILQLKLEGMMVGQKNEKDNDLLRY
jgi:hypothetical protein